MIYTIREFNDDWLGKSVDFDGVYGIQCVDGVRFYGSKLGLGIKSFGGSAINGWNTWCPFDDTWKKVEYKPGMYPKQGDILFWSENRCKNGHTAYANKFCNANVLRYTDQNGTGHRDPFTARFTDYKNLLGWATKK